MKPLKSLIGARLSAIVSLPRHAARRVLLSALAHVLFQPEHKARVARMIAWFPTLDARLRAFSRDNRKQAIGLSPVKRSVPALPMAAPLSGETLPAGTYYRPDFSSLPVSPMKTGCRTIYYFVDHTILCPVNTGMQRVTRRLGRALLEQGEQIRFVRLDAHHRRLILVNRTELASLSQWHGPVLSPADLENYPLPDAQPVYVGKCAPEEGHWLVVPEVTHITYHPQPVTLDVIMAARRLGLKTAFVYYDAIPLRRPELAAMALNHETYMQQLLLADLVVPISDWSARDLVSFFHVHEDAVLTPGPRVATITLPGESPLTPRVPEPVSAGDAEKLILSVGSIEPRKNQLALVYAFEKFCADHAGNDWQLALAGNLHPDVAREIGRALKRNPRISFLEHIPDNELDALYRSCAFTVFPSVEEGFGLPILESLWHAKPCICANFGAMAEVAEGGGCLAVDVREADELVRAITRMTLEPGLLERLSHEAASRPMSTWADYAKRFIEQVNHESDPIHQLGVIYYCVDRTCTVPHNSGIQRVVRGLARALLELGLKLVAVGWDDTKGELRALTADEIQSLAQWDGPAPDLLQPIVLPNEFSQNDWLLMPELTASPGGLDPAAVKAFAVRKGLRVGSIFYDTIPLAMQEIYAPPTAQAHRRYLEGLNDFEQVFANSENGRSDLIQFLAASNLRTPNLDTRILTCALPREFLETACVKDVRENPGTVVKTWRDYAREVATHMATERHIPLPQQLPEPIEEADFYAQFVNIHRRPLLSICVTTYNRAEWLALSLKNLARLIPDQNAEVEIVVCDNTSTDRTPDVVRPYLRRTDFRYYRNPENVGMLGNLSVTAHHASGRYIWILGDDDLIKPGSIERVLQVIRTHPGIALVYLNYAHTREDDAKAVTGLDRFLSESVPIVAPGPDIAGPVHRISTESENFFTAIYCLVFRRDHALRAYSQNTDGRPFSTMLASIPTSYYVLNFMMNEPACWVGEPQLVVNMNVSWAKYASLWILERIPEAHDLAEKMGADPVAVDRWRISNLPGVVRYFREVFENDQESNIDYFSAPRLVSRMKHLDEFGGKVKLLRDIYNRAHSRGCAGAAVPASRVFGAFENS